MKSIRVKVYVFLLSVVILIGSTGSSFNVFSEEPAEVLSKIYCTATIEDSFADNEVLIVVFPEFNDESYDIYDFSAINCVGIKELSKDVQVGTLGRILKLTLSENSKQGVLNAVHILEQREDVYSAEPNYLDTVNMIPDDDSFCSNRQWAISKILLPNAWDMTTGTSTVKVGVIDTGIEATHPDLVNRVDGNLSQCFTDAYDTGIEDANGHGTYVAGVIGAQGNNQIGITGVCWNVTLVSLRVDNGYGYFDIGAAIEAIEYADQVGIQVLNYSGGGYGYNTSVSAREVAIQNYSGLFVCAAGNDDNNNDVTPVYPGSHRLPNPISVGASTSDDRRWFKSNYGHSYVDIFAPGELVFTTTNKRGYENVSGTSVATPYVTGVAALMLAENPRLKPWQIRQMIMDSVDVVYDDDGNSVFGDLCVSGGRLNAYKALLACHVHDEYDDVCAEWHGHTCETCDSMGFEESHEFLYFAANPGAQIGATHRNYCHCGYYRVEYHTVRAPEAGALTFPAVCIFCCGTAMDGNITMSIPPEVSQMSAMGVAPGTYTLSDGTTVQILTENGSYVLPNGIIVLVDEDADLAEAGLLDPYALVENLPAPSNPGHVTE